MNYRLAIDIGASSGRHILGHLEGGEIVLEEMYRFPNAQVRRNGHDCWDYAALVAHVKAGMRACRAAGKIPASVGVDTWGVDFVLTDGNGRPMTDMVAYRDARTAGMDAVVEAAIPSERLYARTGIQKQPFNTIYQLAALMRENPKALSEAARYLMVPDYLHYVLTGRFSNECTIASTTGFLCAETDAWDSDVMTKLGFPAHLFLPPSRPGTVLARTFASAVRAEVGFDAETILPATHDTGSAFLAVPAQNDRCVYISSGTWSLLGVDSPVPILTEAARKANFTNERGACGTWRFLKNIMGLWMIQSVRRELNGEAYVAGKAEAGGWMPEDHVPGRKYSFADLEAAARAATGYAGTVDANDARFLAPASMVAAVHGAADVPPRTVGELVRCVYVSLAKRYAAAIAELERLTGRTYDTVNIVGGGAKDAYLNELTAQATGRDVYAGPFEATALGNYIAQAIAGGEFADLAAARAAVMRSFDVTRIRPA